MLTWESLFRLRSISRVKSSCISFGFLLGDYKLIHMVSKIVLSVCITISRKKKINLDLSARSSVSVHFFEPKGRKQRCNCVKCKCYHLLCTEAPAISYHVISILPCLHCFVVYLLQVGIAFWPSAVFLNMISFPPVSFLGNFFSCHVSI